MENILNKTSDTPRSLADPYEIPDTNFDGNVLLSAIMLKGAQMEPLFTDPRFFYQMNGMWWRKWYPTFSSWATVLEKEYEPLWDRNGWTEIHQDTKDVGTLDTITTGKETIDDDTTGSKSSTEVMDDDTTGSRTWRETMDDDKTGSKTAQEIVDDDATSSATSKTITDTDTTSQENATVSVSAYDASTFQPHDSTSKTGSGTLDSTVDTTAHSTDTDDKTTSYTESTTDTDDWTRQGTEGTTGTDDRTTTFTESTTGTDDRTTDTHGTVDTDTTNDRDFDSAEHSWGNWGISQTSQKLLQSELEVRYWNLYDHISDIFLDEMAVRVY